MTPRPLRDHLAVTPPATAAKTAAAPTIAAEIAELEARIEDLRQQQRAELVTAIAIVVGPGCLFSAAELVERAQLDRTLREALEGASTPRQVGRRLQQLARAAPGRVRLVCVGRDERGCIWAIELHDDAGFPGGAGM